jgi:hypothetical protein
MRSVMALLALLLYFTSAAVHLPFTSQQSARQLDAQKQAWNMLVEGAHGSNMDKRANAIQALGLDSEDPAAVQLAEDALGDKETYVSDTAPPGHSCQTGKTLCAIQPPPECFG